MRVFIGPLEIAGVAVGLVRGLRAMGMTADLRCKHPHPFAYEAQEADSNPLVRFWQQLGVWQQRFPGSVGLLLRLLQAIVGLPVLLLLAHRYDAFIFIFGRTITGSLWDVWILRRLGKRTIVIFCGSDARPPYMDGARSLAGAQGFFAAVRLFIATSLNAHRVRRLERFADVVVNSPATSQFHQRRYVNWFIMGIPRPAAASAPVLLSSRTIFQILHSPSDPVAKGSEHIRAAVAALQAEGLPIQLRELRGVSNQKVLEAISECDLVCDQLYADTPMAAFASEAAALGRPALVGGYFAAWVDQAMPSELKPPSIFVEPHALRDTLRDLVLDRARCVALGAEAQCYVAGNWQAEAVAARYAELIAGRIPESWWCEPDQVNYAQGCGLSEEQAAWRMATLTRYFGVRALRLSGKPQLEAACLALRDRLT